MSDHSWCRDVQRDEAVRAAEDGREGPLPTLEEAIYRAGTFTPSEATQPPNCTERENRLRTERVTLEITHIAKASVTDMRWWHNRLHIDPGYGESVRVVEEAHFDDLANMSLERDAAIRERDALNARVAELEQARERFDTALEEARTRSGVNDFILQRDEAVEELDAAIRERDSWKILADRANEGRDAVAARVAELESAAKAAPEANADGESNHTAPAASGWLTAEEREAVEWFSRLDGQQYSDYCQHCAGVAKSLLARSSPPEVVLPVSTIGRGERYDGDWVEGWIACRERCAAALAAAGVTVKEVGK